MMVGREVILQVDKSAAHPGEVILCRPGPEVEDDRQQLALDGVTLEVRRAKYWAWRACRATARQNWRKR